MENRRSDEVIDLTSDSDEESMTPPPTSPPLPFTSSSLHRSCTAKRSTSPAPQAGLCVPALPPDGSVPLNVSPQRSKLSPFKNIPPWSPMADKYNNVEARGAMLLSTAAQSGECNYRDHDGSGDDELPSSKVVDLTGDDEEFHEPSDDELPSLREIFGARPPSVTGPTDDSSDEASSPSPLLTPSPPVYVRGTQEESNRPDTPASPRRTPLETGQYSCSVRDREPSCDDDLSGQPAVDGSTEQAAQPPAARGEHHILEADPDIDTRVGRVAESHRSSTTPTTTTTTSRALEIGDHDIGCRNKRPANDNNVDACAEGEGQPATAATVGHRKRQRRSDAPKDVVDGDGDEPARDACRRPIRGPTGPSRSIRQTRRARQPVSMTIEEEILGDLGTEYAATVREGRKTWRGSFIEARFDPEWLRAFKAALETFKVAQRSRRRAVRGLRRSSRIRESTTRRRWGDW